LARLAVDRGARAVVLEKPMCASIAEARSLVEYCRERNVLLTVMHQMRFSDEFVAAKEAIAAGGMLVPGRSVPEPAPAGPLRPPRHTPEEGRARTAPRPARGRRRSDA